MATVKDRSRDVLTGTIGSNRFYLRNNLGDAGGVPENAPFNQCPDIIQSGTPVTNPQATFSTAQSWATAYNVAPDAGVNYYYVRGKNGSQHSSAPQVSLFAAEAQMLLWPELWSSGALTTTDGNRATQIGAVNASAIGVGADPFCWNRSGQLANNGFYSMLAWTTDSANPQPLPTASSFADLAALLTSTPGLAINQVVTLNAGDGSWLVRLGLSVPQGVPDAVPINFVVSGSGLNGATVGLLADTFTAEGTLVEMIPTPLSNGDFMGFSAKLQPGYAGTLAIQIWPGSTAPSDGAYLNVFAFYNVSSSAFAQAQERGILNPIGSRTLPNLGVTPQTTAPLGEITILFEKS